uniref:D-arabinitol 2-dehydrogenase [ribulose-forming] n=1 Tax=Anolis carolinensis TaxID=28377 RepID=R4GB59_ANOCA
MPHYTEISIRSIAEMLKRARDIAHRTPDVPEELRTCLQKALDATRGLELSSTSLGSSNRTTSSVDCHQNDLFCETKIKTKEEQPSCDAEGQLYRMLVQMMRARRILVIGMFNFPCLLAMVDVVPDDGKITLCAPQSYLGEATQKAPDFLSHRKKIREKNGPITDSLKEFAAMGEDFDIVFLDADQRSPAEYYRFVMENHLLRMDGMLCVRNALMKGRGYLENTADENVLDVKTLNQVINSDPRTEQVILPVQGGLILLRRQSLCIHGETSPRGVVKDEVFWGFRECRILDRLQLDGKVAYITGGGQGIGRAFCHALGEAGAKVAVVDLIPAKADAVAHELSLKGIKSMAVVADVSKPEDIQKMLDKVVAKWGTVHIACNNAGINMNSPSEETSLEEWDKTFSVNLRGLFLCCQAAGRIMLNQGYGKIINTASMASLIVPHPQKQLAYNTSKAGVVKLTQTLGTEWINRGVRVNCISPGIVDTPLIHSEELKPLVQRWLTDIPAGRLAQVTDLQAAVVYLASEASDYMTGHNLVIEGGQSLW